MLLADFEPGCVDRFADLALVSVNLKELFAFLLIFGCCGIKTLLLLRVCLCRKQAELKCIGIYRKMLFRTAAIQLLLQIGDTEILCDELFLKLRILLLQLPYAFFNRHPPYLCFRLQDTKKRPYMQV